LIREVEELVMPGSDPFRTASAAEAIDDPRRMALLVPDDDAVAVHDLSSCCDQILANRDHPVVLFLLRNGDGLTELARSPSLSSVVRGRDVDPEQDSEMDVSKERDGFIAGTGNTPKDWLVAWHAGRIRRDGNALSLAYLAAMLVEDPRIDPADRCPIGPKEALAGKRKP
jgi:hypothetical protein